MFVVGGESLIDLVQDPPAAEGALRMTAYAGGSPYNCSIALSRLGNGTGFLCPISRDGFGSYLLAPLAEAGVEVLLPDRVPAPTTLAVVTLNARMEAQYEFYRAADRAFSADRLLAALPPKLELFQIGGFCAIEPTDADVWLEVVREARRRGAVLSIDPNVRPSLVGDFHAYRDRLGRFLDLVHIAKLSREDLNALDPGKPLEVQAQELLSRPGCELVVVTLGEEGSLAFTAAGGGRAGIWSPPVFGDTVGAGDSLMAGILTWLCEGGRLSPGRLTELDGPALDSMLAFGAVVAGLNCGEKGCKPPTRAEVDAVLAAR
jgi:fructokinase